MKIYTYIPYIYTHIYIYVYTIFLGCMYPLGTVAVTSKAHPTRLVASGGDVAIATRGGRMVLEVMKRRGLKKLKKTQSFI